MNNRLLVLENGMVFHGTAFGGNKYQVGELAFHTGMLGYEDVLRDVSNYGQIMMMTYPMIGNYGINAQDFKDVNCAIFGLVVGEYCETPSNWRSEMTLNAYLTQQNIAGICDIDTRKLTRILRNEGSMKAMMCDEDANIEEVVKTLKTTSVVANQVEKVVKKETYELKNNGDRIVVVNFGDYESIVDELTLHGKDVVVVPYSTSVEDILALQGDGVILSNGPGNPEEVREVLPCVQTLMDSVPVFGIGLGHQLICMACGASIDKLKFGHRGGNHPVLHLESNQTKIVSQNHAYVVNEASLKDTPLKCTHIALNDKSVEGVEHTQAKVLGIQYKPEASKSKDAIHYLYKQFYDMIQTQKEGK